MERSLVLTGVTGKKSSGAFVRQLHGHINEVRTAFPGGIRAIVRPSSDPEYLKEMIPDVQLFVGEFAHTDILNQALAEADTLVHIAGIHWSLPVVEAAARQGLRRVILVHTTGIYSRYKAAGETYRQIDAEVTRICQENNIVLTILRPTMIYGSLSDRNISEFIRMVDKLPWMPVVRGGQYALQPVWYEDLGLAYYRVLADEQATGGKNYILSGGAPILLRDLLEEIGRQLGKKRVRFVSCPYWLAYSGAAGLRILSLGRVDYREKVQRLCEDRAYPHEPAQHDFSYAPACFSEGVRDEIQAYLQKKASENRKTI